MFRIEHLELVAALARKHRLPELTSVALQMYWALYTGVLAFWECSRNRYSTTVGPRSINA